MNESENFITYRCQVQGRVTVGSKFVSAVTVDESRVDENRVDELLRVLSRARRRVVLRSLLTRGGETTLDELVADLAESADRSESRARIALQHNHLPKLEEADVVEYDPETGRVDYRRNPAVETLLDVVASLGER